MTSILTNTAAMSALQTLRSIGSSMEETQARVSSGLRVGGAADNAAYWSIATTMRSDNMALSAVSDALGLGAAKVDTAYAGMESAIEVVKEIKAKLVAATEDGVDKAKIQEEIDQLQDQLKSISQSASFSGENWLQADLSNGPQMKDVVSGFVRTENTVSVKKTTYELNGSTVLFDVADVDAEDKGGILDKHATVGNNAVNLTEVSIVKDIHSTKTVSNLEETTGLTLTMLNAVSGVATGAPAIEAYANTAGTEIYIRKYDSLGNIEIDAKTGEEKWVRIKAFDPSDTAATAKLDKANASGTGSDITDGAVAPATELTFYYLEDQETTKHTVTALTKAALESAANGVTTAEADNPSVEVVVTGRVATITTDNGTTSTDEIYVQVDPEKDVWVKAEEVLPGNTTKVNDNLPGININGKNYDIVHDNKTLPAALTGNDLKFSVSTLDIKDLAAVATRMGGTEAKALDFMIQYVDDALTAMTSSAAALGSIAMRIDLQEEFVSKLSESIDSGIGRLVDADLNEESTRLKALQTQQQLAIQSLSIANSSSEVILSLFR